MNSIYISDNLFKLLNIVVETGGNLMKYVNYQFVEKFEGQSHGTY